MEEKHHLFHSIHQLSRNLTKRLNAALEPYEIYSSQWSVLFILKEKGSMTQKELCSYLAIEAPPMTRTIQKLQKLGLIEQTEGQDKRKRYIALTNKALTNYPVWEKAVMDVNNQISTSLSENHQKELQMIVSEWLRKL
ncbi:MarR family winged helix-turn-helix transcriptional regulator [Robertmurraya korlensis]|uniref:MarR family winged helix-turn-helix transcriptional regulator n=1 Tax=Robertmurraya korlensis TaxID=519977 RepID=UPI0008265C2F|nr:MarR family transcriptional regulator [Robertmurraya korlensis]